MKFSMNSKNLVDALDKMHRISTKGVKNEYDMTGRVTIESTPDKVLFRTSNGHLYGVWEVTKDTDSAIKGSDPGVVTVDVTVLRQVARALGKDNVVTLEVKDNALLVSDTTTKKKRKAKIETIGKKHHDFTIRKSSGFSYTFPVDVFRRAVRQVSKYASNLAYKIRYQMICLHFLPDEVRFVCGDGMRFGILSFITGSDNLSATGVDDAAGVKYIMPADQAEIISGVIDSNTEKVTIRYESDTSCFISPYDGMKLHLKGIPNEKYIAYETHADGRDSEVEALVTLPCEDYVDGIALVLAVKDKSIETEGNFHSAAFRVAEGTDFKFEVNERRYSCEFETPAEFKKIKDRTNFNSEYAVSFLADVADACAGKDVVEFSCIDEYGTILAEPKTERGNDNPRIRFFFASALEEEEDSE